MACVFKSNLPPNTSGFDVAQMAAISLVLPPLSVASNL
jgi:hypothetical protein